VADTLRVAVSGATGRMGRTLARLIAGDAGLELVGGVDRGGARDADSGYPRIHTPDDARPLLERADVLIDFSAPDFLAALLDAHADALRGRAVVVGTTGLGPEETARLDHLAGNSPVLTAANFSVGVNLLLSLAEQAARVLGEEYDVEVVEAHHRRKEDAPSGTALALGEAVAAGRGVELDRVRRDGRSGRPGARPGGEIGFHAVRGGDVVGEHVVLFLGELERVELAHRASDRALFAAGALRAARWLAGREPGRYTMRDALGLA
jgi:4-hydroxy-tetrahydrodipicolinate reductase